MYSRHFELDDEKYNREMQKLKSILEEKGYVSESDHWIAYQMQYEQYVDEINEWLHTHNYCGSVCSDGMYCQVGAVYDLYDSDRVSAEENKKYLLEEANRQFSDIFHDAV